MSKLTVYNMQGERTGTVDFPDELLVLEKGEQAVHDAVVALLANRRSGTAKTKKRDEVSGGGKKPFAQKGTGRARAGSIRSPIWRGGGTVFGPQPRSYYQRLPKKVARLAFARVLSDRIAGGQLCVVERFDPAGAKTKTVAALLKKLAFKKGALLVVERGNEAALRAARNLAGVTVAAPADVNTYDVIRHPQVLVSQPALAVLQERLRQRQGRTA